MQRGRGERDDFFGGGFGDPFAGFRSFGDPFAGFRGFGDPFGAFGGFGVPGSLASRFFGGRDPFEDPFFNRPSGGLMGPSIFPIGMVPQISPFGEPINTRFVQQQAPESNSSKGPIIKELNSDGEEEEEEEEEEEVKEEEGNANAEEKKNTRFVQQQAPESNSSKGPIIKELNSDGEEEGNAHAEEKKNNSRKHSRSSKEPYVEDPGEANQEKKSKRMQFRNDFSRTSIAQPQARTYSFQSSTVTYGGINGTYYTSSTSRRTGGDGVTLEESKEADTTIGKATHRISRGIRDKGHSVTRKLNTDGRVETMQMLHNLNEDDLGGFEEAWMGNAKEHLPGWNQNVNILVQGNNDTRGQNEVLNGRGWALPSTEQPYGSERIKSQRPNSSSRLSNGRAP